MEDDGRRQRDLAEERIVLRERIPSKRGRDDVEREDADDDGHEDDDDDRKRRKQGKKEKHKDKRSAGEMIDALCAGQARLVERSAEGAQFREHRQVSGIQLLIDRA